MLAYCRGHDHRNGRSRRLDVWQFQAASRIRQQRTGESLLRYAVRTGELRVHDPCQRCLRVKHDRNVQDLPYMAQLMGERQDKAHVLPPGPRRIEIDEEIVVAYGGDNVGRQALSCNVGFCNGTGMMITVPRCLLFPSGPHVSPVGVLLQVFFRAASATIELILSSRNTMNWRH